MIKLKRAHYTASSDLVALAPKKAFAVTTPVQVLVYGTGQNALEDTDGRDIDGDDNSTSGGNAVAIIAKKGVTIDAVPAVRTSGKSARTSAIDALLARGGLAELSSAFSPRRELRHQDR